MIEKNRQKNRVATEKFISMYAHQYIDELYRR